MTGGGRDRAGIGGESSIGHADAWRQARRVHDGPDERVRYRSLVRVNTDQAVQPDEKAAQNRRAGGWLDQGAHLIESEAHRRRDFTVERVARDEEDALWAAAERLAQRHAASNPFPESPRRAIDDRLALLRRAADHDRLST